MTRLRFLGAAATVDLVGVEQLPLRTLELLREVAAPMIVDAGATSAPTDHDLTVSRDEGGVLVGDILLPATPGEAAATVFSLIDRALLRSSRCLHIHAAAVGGPRGVAIVPAVSGAGKTTLAAAAMQAGLRLLSDEAACIDMTQDLVWPHPRPLGLSLHSRKLLHLPGNGGHEVAMAPDLIGETAHVDRGYPPAVVVIATRQGMDRLGPPGYVLSESRPSEGLATVLRNRLPSGAALHLSAEESWRRCVQLMRSVRVVSLVYEEPAAGATGLVELVG